MLQPIILLVLTSTLLAFPGEKDEVIILPGLHFQPNFRHYSGYLNGSATRQLHYWFVESQNSPNTDPLVLWLNGGPGCSSLLGFLTENGPFQVTPQGYLIDNPYSWNKIANVIYLESPSCVGYSYSTDGKCDASDDSTSLLNFNALNDFLIKFPQYKNRDFYITGESYGGVYIPTLSVRIISSTPSLPVKFKGIAVGNGYSSKSINNNGNFYFAYYHGLISDSLWSEILSHCCLGQNRSHCDIMGNKNEECQTKINAAMYEFSNINVYNIYADCYTPPNSVTNAIWSQLGIHSNYEKHLILTGWNADFNHRISKLRRQFSFMVTALSQLRIITSDNIVIPCTDDTVSINYFNNPKVRYALHIPDNVPQWASCSATVNLNYERTYENMTSQYNSLFKLKNFKIWIYNGDVDMACSYLSDEWFFEKFNQKVISHRKPWIYNNSRNSSQIGGFVKILENMVLLTIRGSGHMVPTDKPIAAYHMFDSFIFGKVL